MSDKSLETLADLRHEIDRIDGEMHALLMERGEIIDRLIAVKARQGGGSAFRPGREADMMRVIASRHTGRLPLDTVESIWRVIISTFTYVQSNYAVHADLSGGDAAIRDSARFHFGFTVPLVGHATPGGVIEAVAASLRQGDDANGADAGGDLGMIRAGFHAEDARWWERLAALRAPKIIARLPFVERPDHPAGTPVFIISNPLNEAAARDVALFSATGTGPAPDAESWAVQGCDILGQNDGDGFSLLLSAPGGWSEDKIKSLPGGAAIETLAWIGSHAERFSLSSQ
jgi:chorismate mutase